MFISNKELLRRLTSPKETFFDPERQKKIRALRKKGYNLREIGEMYNLSRQRIHQILIHPRKYKRQRLKERCG